MENIELNATKPKINVEYCVCLIQNISGTSDLITSKYLPPQDPENVLDFRFDHLEVPPLALKNLGLQI